MLFDPALTETLMQLALFFSLLLMPLLGLGVHLLCRDVLELHLSLSHSKRAMKEARRRHFSLRFADGFRLGWQRELAAADDRTAQQLLTLNTVQLMLFPLFEGICIAAHWIAVFAWIAPVCVTLFAVVLLWLWIRKAAVSKKAPEEKSPRYEKKVPAAHWIYKGYLLSALGCLYAQFWFPAGLFLTAGAVHLLILRRRKSDLFYCTVQLIEHRATTPHHHTEGFRRFAEREGLHLAVIELVIGVPCLLIPIITRIFDIPMT